MSKNAQRFERITISLPGNLFRNVEELKDELNISKSEILKIAFEKFLEAHKKRKLQKLAEIMLHEYEKDKKLPEFADLDGDNFKLNNLNLHNSYKFTKKNNCPSLPLSITW